MPKSHAAFSGNADVSWGPAVASLNIYSSESLYKTTLSYYLNKLRRINPINWELVTPDFWPAFKALIYQGFQYKFWTGQDQI